MFKILLLVLIILFVVIVTYNKFRDKWIWNSGYCRKCKIKWVFMGRRYGEKIYDCGCGEMTISSNVDGKD